MPTWFATQMKTAKQGIYVDVGGSDTEIGGITASSGTILGWTTSSLGGGCSLTEKKDEGD
jgi:hypothetical protein